MTKKQLTIVMIYSVFLMLGHNALASFQQLPMEMKVKIVSETSLKAGDVAKFGLISKGLNEAIKIAIRSKESYISGKQLTKYNVESLKWVGTLRLNLLDAENETLKLIGKLTNLRELRLEKTKITDVSLGFLCQLINLKKINLSYTQITDASLEYLCRLRNIKKINVSFTGITKEGIQRLKRGLPSIRQICLDSKQM